MKAISVEELDRAIFILRLSVTEHKRLLSGAPHDAGTRRELSRLCDNVRVMIGLRDALKTTARTGPLH